jgi:Relaxase/Mobilisation nuclease domain/Large polyvalent protein-associated domain 7
MIGKVIKGKGFRGAVEYLFNGNKYSTEKNAVIVSSNMAGLNPRELSKEFSGLRKLRPTLSKAVCHISLSLAPDDKKLDDKQFGEVAEIFLKEMGFQNCPFVAVRHQDTEHPHIHIVVSRITTNGDVVTDKHDFQRAENIIRQLETTYELRAVLPSVHTPKNRRNRRNNNQGEIKMQKQKELIKSINHAIVNSKSMEEWIMYLNELDITIKPYIDDNGKVKGASYRYQDDWYKSSSLGEEFKWSSIAQQYGNDPTLIRKSVLGKIAQQPNIYDNQISNTGVSSADITDARRDVMEEKYVESVWELYKGEINDIKIGNGSLKIQFENGGKIIDEGNSIYCIKMSDDEAAKSMMKLAVLKKWNRIEFRGSDSFVRIAMEEAITHGLEVHPIDESQKKILYEVQLKLEQEKEALELRPNQLGKPEEDSLKISIGSAKDKLAGHRAIDNDAFRHNGPRRSKGV